jgi:hypothetical protein
MHAADEHVQEKAFRARLKHLQRLGLPIEENKRDGRRIKYGPNEVYQLAFALELSECGLDPKVIVGIITSQWDRMRKKIRFAHEIARDNDRYSDVTEGNSLILLRTRIMQLAWDDPSATDNVPIFSFTSVVGNTLDSEDRVIVINVTRMVEKLRRLLDRFALEWE